MIGFYGEIVTPELTSEELEGQREMFRSSAWRLYSRKLETEGVMRAREAVVYAAITGKEKEAAFASGEASMCGFLLSWPDVVKSAMEEKKEEEEQDGRD